jgi:two-component system CheB/CheR fusion protein
LQLKLKELNKSQKHLSELTHIALHDIREPIRNIYTTIEMLIRNEAKNLSDNSKAAFRRMQASLNRMNLVLDDTITLTQISLVEKPKEIFKLNEIIDEVKKILEQRLRDSKAVISNGDFCEIRAHKDLVVLLLHHILSNAIKHINSQNPVMNVHCKKTDKGDYYQMSISFQADGFESSSIAMVIATRVMETHEGYMETEQIDDETYIRCYFPAN